MALRGFRQERSGNHCSDCWIVAKQVLKGFRIVDVYVLRGEICQLLADGPLRWPHLRGYAGIWPAGTAEFLTGFRPQIMTSWHPAYFLVKQLIYLMALLNARSFLLALLLLGKNAELVLAFRAMNDAP